MLTFHALTGHKLRVLFHFCGVRFLDKCSSASLLWLAGLRQTRPIGWMLGSPTPLDLSKKHSFYGVLLHGYAD